MDTEKKPNTWNCNGGISHVFMVDKATLVEASERIRHAMNKQYVEYLKETENYEELARLKKEGKI